MFQSPSLRGSGRFLWQSLLPIESTSMFQSPSLRGSGRFAQSQYEMTPHSSCFNPLHCGAVVASRGCLLAVVILFSLFQSPSLRGSGRFTDTPAMPKRTKLIPFQSPSLRGSGRFLLLGGVFLIVTFGFNPLHCGAVVASLVFMSRYWVYPEVSIPFIAGQWSLRGKKI